MHYGNDYITNKQYHLVAYNLFIIHHHSNIPSCMFSLAVPPFHPNVCLFVPCCLKDAASIHVNAALISISEIPNREIIQLRSYFLNQLFLKTQRDK